MKNQITKNNILISDFMGYEKDDSFYSINVFNLITFNQNKHHEEQLCFNLSWDWLMPVVEKIESLNATVIIDEDCTIEFGGEYLESTNSMHNCDFETFKTKGTKIKKVYDAVVEFINWYNKK